MIEILRLRMKRHEYFRNVGRHLRKIKEMAQKHLEDAKVYVFGSFVEGKHTPASDIDVLIVSGKLDPDVRAKIIADVYRELGYEHPFEIHLSDSDGLRWYRRFARLVEVEDFIAERDQSREYTR